MNRQPFYEVPEDAYLFKEILAKSASQNKEEPVRQWCAFELIRSYGIPIYSLRFEYVVKLGSKGLKADIVVMRNDRPWIVVECKHLDHDKHEKAATQGLGYANAGDVNAPYFLYTNGNEWQAHRKADDLWMAIDDLPAWEDIQPAQDLVAILTTFSRLKPVLYKLDENLIGGEAGQFLSCLHRLFYHGNPLLYSVDEHVIDAADHILRTLVDKTHVVAYRVEKLTIAARDWEEFRAARGIGRPIDPYFDERFKPFLNSFQMDLEALLPHLVKPFTVDARLLRLCITLLAYAMSNDDGKGDHAPITSAIHQSLRAFLDSVLAEKFHCQLPDVVDGFANERMKDECRHAWEEHTKTDS